MRTIEERFSGKFTPEPFSGCWLWTGGCRGHNQGYGAIWKDGRHSLAHRVSWEINKGLIPEGFNVLHKCDTPLCVNPDHLFLGTHSDNAYDRETKGCNLGIGIFNDEIASMEKAIAYLKAHQPRKVK